MRGRHSVRSNISLVERVVSSDTSPQAQARQRVGDSLRVLQARIVGCDALGFAGRISSVAISPSTLLVDCDRFALGCRVEVKIYFPLAQGRIGIVARESDERRHHQIPSHPFVEARIVGSYTLTQLKCLAIPFWRIFTAFAFAGFSARLRIVGPVYAFNPFPQGFFASR